MNISRISSQSPFAPRMPFGQTSPVGAAMSPHLGWGDQFIGNLFGDQGSNSSNPFQSFLGHSCPCGPNHSSAFSGLFSMMSIMSQLLAMLQQMNPQALAQSGRPNFGQGFPMPGAPSQGGAPPALAGAPSSSTGMTHPSPSPGATAPSPSPATTSQSPSSGSGASPVKIGPGTRVLEIGDSHSVGTFGKELDKRLRGTGAQVSTYASAGATASTFVQGKSTKYGYWQKEANGSESSTNYGQSRQTPKLENLINQNKPEVIVVNLGANFRGQNPKSQVDQIGRIAKKHGIPIVWVGPPKTSKDGGQASSLKSFDQKMAQAVAPYGTYVPSTPHVSKYSGGDGLHFGGREGTQIAKQWAQGVFNSIVG